MAIKLDVQEYLNSIVVGIRFRPNFSLEDKFGTILDEILYSKDSYFDPKFFPTTHQSVGGTDRKLNNEETGDQLTLNTSNIILEYNLPSAGESDTLDSLLPAFKGQIVLGIMRKHAVTQIQRVGMIHRYLFNVPELARHFLTVTVGKTLEGVNDINLRFSKRYALEESLVRKGVNDYANVIFNIIKKADKEELFVSIDYQWCFAPALDKAAQMEFETFLEKAKEYNKTNFPKWLLDNYGQ